MQVVSYISSRSSLPGWAVENTVQLLDQACTVPFIARYRKDKTGNLDEVQIGAILKYKEEFEALEKRKASILNALEEQEVLTPELKEKIAGASGLVELEDLYLPFRKTRKTRADAAREKGLEPLAKIIMSQPGDLNGKKLKDLVSRFKTEELKSSEEVWAGTRDIIAAWINERTFVRNLVRNEIRRRGRITTRVVKKFEKEEEAQKFRDYFDWDEPLHRIPSHRFLAIMRAASEGFIRFKIEVEDDVLLKKIENSVVKSEDESADQIRMAVANSYRRLLFPSLENEAIAAARERADDTAIGVFAKNLQQLLLGSPLGEKRVLAIDPGFRSGCKIVCLDARGNLEYNETIYPHPPQNERKAAMNKISSLADAYQIEAVAIGNGTASRETERLVKQIRFKNEIQVFIVNEAGASVYSASKIARSEFPDYDVTVRGAVSIGRRLQDPLAELVKIDPKAIGVGQYQHDVDQNKLKKSLDSTVEHCVNAVGVNLNTGSASLLSYVSGIGPRLAEAIVDFREKTGAFTSREDLKNVPRVGEKTFEQAAGFLRVKNGKNPLDDSFVHPESYDIVAAMAASLKVEVSELIGNKQLLDKINPADFLSESAGTATLQDIVEALEKPGIDIRGEAKIFTFNQNIKSIHDLESGQLLPGIVNNITNFGCFVDIGIQESGLIHISNLSDSFVKDVNDIVHLHQQVIVKVLEVDTDRKRIQLQLHKTV